MYKLKHILGIIIIGLMPLYSLFSAQTIATLTGEIEEAPYIVHVPSPNIGEVVYLLPGYRPEDATRSLTLDITEKKVEHLLQQGYIVATTCYRRNGMVVKDGMMDVQLLRDLIQKYYKVNFRDRITHNWLMGTSMGAQITVQLLEKDSDLFNGGIAIGFPNLDVDDNELTHRLISPLVFLVNQSEIKNSRYYRKTAIEMESTFVPVIREIKRDGHVNVRAEEIIAAFDQLKDWRKTRSFVDIDGTIQPDLNRPSEVKFSSEKSFLTKVIEVNPVHGNFTLSAQPIDFEKLNIKKGDNFFLTFEKQTVAVLSGSSFGDVPVGEWVSFPSAEGYIFVSRNSANAVKTLGINKGSIIEIRQTPQN